MKTKDIILTAFFASLIFVGTYFFKIPISFANGYTHLGDALLIVAVLSLGTKRGVIAAGIGMGLSDLIGGYMVWVLPTMIIKMVWALCVGLFRGKTESKTNLHGWCIGAALGGVIQIIGYTLVKIILYGTKPAFIELPITLKLETFKLALDFGNGNSFHCCVTK